MGGLALSLDLGIRNGSRGWNMGGKGQEKPRTGRSRNEEQETESWGWLGQRR